MDPHILAPITILLLIACIVAILVRWIKQPYSIALVVVGLMIALLKISPSVFISHDVIFMLILPPLLFHGAMHMDLERLRNNWRAIAMLAIPGVVASTFLIGFLLHTCLGLDLIYALLFGALITPTDPVSVLAILRSVGAPKRLQTILEGESLFNDGTGVVVFAIILSIITGQEHFEFSHAVWEFFKVGGGGTVIGLLFGYIAYNILKRLDDHLLEVAITVVLTFGTPLVAEAFHMSGIIAIVVAGLIIGNYGRIYSMSEKTREALEHFWEVIEFLLNSLIFLVIGLELQVITARHLPFLWKPIAVTIGAVLISRFIVVYPVVWIKRGLTDNEIPWRWAHVLFWGGLKGSMSIALVVGLPHSVADRDLFLTLAFSVVLFSLIVQGLTMKPLIQKLGLSGAK